MSSRLIQGQTYVKRLSMPPDYQKEVIKYGNSNLYPQMGEQILLRSPITKSAASSLSDFIFGEGLTNDGDMVVNRLGQTLNDIAEFLADTASIYNGGRSLFFNVNELFLITEIFPQDFKNCRFKIPEEDMKGIHTHIGVSNNWERDSQIDRGQTVIKFFPRWQHRDLIDFSDVEFEDIKGFMYYEVPRMEQYTDLTFDAVLDSAQTNANIQTFELGNIQNGFSGLNLFKYPSNIEGSKELDALEQKIREAQGPENANTILLVKTSPDFTGEIVEPIGANNNDRLYELTNDTTVGRILANYSQPYPISGIQPPNGGIFNREEIENATLYYNAKTRRNRLGLLRSINSFMEFWHEGPVVIEGIREIQFEQQEASEEEAPDQDEEQQDNEVQMTPEQEATARLTKIYGT